MAMTVQAAPPLAQLQEMLGKLGKGALYVTVEGGKVVVSTAVGGAAGVVAGGVTFVVTGAFSVIGALGLNILFFGFREPTRALDKGVQIIIGGASMAIPVVAGVGVGSFTAVTVGQKVYAVLNENL